MENLIKKEKKSPIEIVLFGIILIFLLASLALEMFFSFICVDGSSMENTLQNKQYVIVTTGYFKAKRGDIVCIDREWFNGEKEPLIKRVIAIDGDKLLFMYSADRTQIDTYICKSGENSFALCDEPYIKAAIKPNNNYSFIPLYHISDIENIRLDGDSEYLADIERCQIVIGKNEFYFMGDNRNNSSDSRGTYGIFDRKHILAKVIKIVTLDGELHKFIDFFFTAI